MPNETTTLTPWVEFRVIRNKDGASIKYLAGRTGYSERYLYDLQAGTRRPTTPVIAALADALNVPKSMLEPRVAA
jgi:transcriptional regulator with XRE-family HTH domain